LEQKLLIYFEEGYLKSDPLYSEAIENVIYSVYENDKQEGFRLSTKKSQHFFDSELIEEDNEFHDMKLQEQTEAFELSKNNSQMIFSTTSRNVPFSVFKTLSIYSWIDDEVGLAYSLLLNQRELALCSVDSSRSKNFFLNPILSLFHILSINLELIDDEARNLQIDKMKTSFKELELGYFDRVFMLSNQYNKHWVLYIIDVKNLSIDLFDSYHRGLTISSEIQINQIKVFFGANLLFEENSAWKITSNQCNFQKTSCDCGIFMLTYCLFLADDIDISCCKNIDCSYLSRLKIAVDITRGYIEDPRLVKFVGY
jgi:hypothetical protein